MEQQQNNANLYTAVVYGTINTYYERLFRCESYATEVFAASLRSSLKFAVAIMVKYVAAYNAF